MADKCYGGEHHLPTESISYGDGKRRTICSRCMEVLSGPPIPPPDIASLDAGDIE